MILREILKKIRQIELRTNWLAAETLADEMPMPLMKTKLIYCLVLVFNFIHVGCLFAQSDQASTNISKAQVLIILDSIDKGLTNKDAATVVANFASNAVITATIIERQDTDTIRSDTDKYRRDLEAGFKTFQNYKLQRKEVRVEIAVDGKTATSLSTLVEKYRFDGKAKNAVTRESATFELIDGKVLLTKLSSKVKIE